jgi:hypothetical protein
MRPIIEQNVFPRTQEIYYEHQAREIKKDARKKGHNIYIWEHNQQIIYSFIQIIIKKGTRRIRICSSKWTKHSSWERLRRRDAVVIRFFNV